MLRARDRLCTPQLQKYWDTPVTLTHVALAGLRIRANEDVITNISRSIKSASFAPNRSGIGLN